MQKILREMKRTAIDAFSFSGGDPLHPKNAPTVAEIGRRVKEETGKPIWLWTGYEFDALDELQRTPLQYCDYLITGPFIEELKDLSLKWRRLQEPEDMAEDGARLLH